LIIFEVQADIALEKVLKLPSDSASAVSAGKVSVIFLHSKSLFDLPKKLAWARLTAP
jgi:hypothetical protein